MRLEFLICTSTDNPNLRRTGDLDYLRDWELMPRGGGEGGGGVEGSLIQRRKFL